MSVLVVEYERDGSIDSYRYEPDEDYTPTRGEFIPDGEVDHRKLISKRVDLSGETPTVVDDEDYDPRTKAEKALDEIKNLKGENPVRRAKITQAEKQAFQDARKAQDVQGQLDALYEMLTGDKLE